MKFKKGDKLRWHKSKKGEALTFIVLETPEEIGHQFYRIYDNNRDTATYQTLEEVEKYFLHLEDPHEET